MDQALEFFVQGSQVEPYRVTFRKDGVKVAIFCTCRAGKQGDCCKHKLALIAGNDESIIGGNRHELNLTSVLLADGHIHAAIQTLNDADVALEIAKNNRKQAKHALSALMRGNG
jgi:SWIM zinc finger